MDNQKQQIIEKLQAANNILVTVPASPSVDQLSAAIGVTLLLNKMNKHASAVFSGNVPRSLAFLKPDETLEKDTDSLRDFIVALDKSKADKLRYKVEDEVVKIFITPYKSSITENDLVFSQGDFNVDVVLALGVLRQQDLDTAITANGRILHDAVFIVISNKQSTEQLGNISWQELGASGLSELVASLGIDMGKEMLDEQIATALLTGIVAETDHFGNQKTTPQTMTVSATLLAAGANQQLIARELSKGNQPMQQQGQQKKKQQQPEQQNKADIAQAGPDGSLSIRHKPGEKRKKKFLKQQQQQQNGPKPLEEGQSIEDILKSSGAVSDEVPQDVNTIITSAEADPFAKIETEDSGNSDENNEGSDETYTDDASSEDESSEGGEDGSSDQSDESTDESEEGNDSEPESDQDDSDKSEEKPAEEEHKDEPKEEPKAEAPKEEKKEEPEDEPISGLIKDAAPASEESKLEPMPAPPAPDPAPEPAPEPAAEPPKVELPAPDLSINDLPGFEPSPSEPAPSAPSAPSAPAPTATNPLPELNLSAPDLVTTPEAGDAESPADVDAARKRVEDALKDTSDGLPQDFNAINVNLDLGHEAGADPGAGSVSLPAPSSDPNSVADLIQPPGSGPDLSMGMPAANAPAPLNPLDSPVVSPAPAAMPHNPAVNEQAPLSNSPADQAQTMPVPGPAPDDVKAAFGKTPNGLNVPPPTQLPQQGPPPPPVPPPAVPPNFIPGP